MRVTEAGRRDGSARRQYLLGTAASLLALLAGPAPALAQQPAPAAAAVPAKINFNIPAQDLTGAILSFAQKAGIQVFYDIAKVQGLHSTTSRLGPVVGYVARDSISATKTATPIIETPQSVTVITRQEMDAQGKVQDVRDILRYAPGTYISDDYDNRLESLLVRGFQPDQYLDGLRLLSGTFSTLQVDPYMLKRAELLEGPASVLYGQEASSTW